MVVRKGAGELEGITFPYRVNRVNCTCSVGYIETCSGGVKHRNYNIPCTTNRIMLARTIRSQSCNPLSRATTSEGRHQLHVPVFAADALSHILTTHRNNAGTLCFEEGGQPLRLLVLLAVRNFRG